MGLVKPIVPRLRWGHPLTGGLRQVLAFAERGGTTTRNAVTLADATLVGAPTWLTGPYGPHLGFVGASSQYVNAGPLPWLSGAAAFTLVALTRRVTLGDNLPIGVGATLATTVGISGTNVMSCRIGTGVADAYSNTSNDTVAWQHVVMAFDGSQGTAINRVALYINGAPQTLTMGSGTFPATAPTTSASVWVGAMEAVSFYGTGECAGVWWYDRTLSQADAVAHFADPWGMFETPPVRRMVFGPAAPFVAPPTGTWNSANPADGETDAETIGAASVVFDPTDPLNPPDTWEVEVDGVDRTADLTVTGAGGNAERGTVEFFFEFERAYEVVWTVRTADDNPNTYTQTFTVRRAIDWEAESELVALIVPYGAVTDERVDLVTDRGTSPWDELLEIVAENAYHVTDDLMEVTVLAGLGDGYYTDEVMRLIVATLVDQSTAMAGRLDAGPGFRLEFAGRLQVEGVGESVLAGREEVISSRQFIEFAGRSEVGYLRETEMAGREEVGPRADTVLAGREEVDGVAFAPIQGTAVSRNEDRAAVEDA